MALFGRRKRAAATAVETDEAVPEQAPAPQAMPISVEEYREALLAIVEPLPPLGMGVLDAFGLRLCETVTADLELPMFTSASADGYAVHAVDVASASTDQPVTMPVIDTLDSPVYRGAPLLEHTAVRVAVGAPIPEGADAVVPLDQTDGGDDQVVICATIAPGQHLRLAGSDIADGTVLLAEGERLDAGALGLLAEVGHDKVLVRQPPRVAVLTVGPNLVSPGLALAARAHRYDATTTLIAAAAKADGGRVFPAGTYGDDPGELRQALTEQLILADLVIVVGGLDGPVPDVLQGLGEATVQQVTIHPGSTQAHALVGEDRTPVIALPGGAASAFVGYHAFVRPVLRRLQGEPDEQPHSHILPARVALHGRDGATDLIPAVISDRGVEPCGVAGAELAYDVARADGLIVLAPGTQLVPANSDVEVWLLRPPAV